MLHGQFPLLLHFGGAPHPDFRRHSLKAMLAVHGAVGNPPVVIVTNITPYLEVRHRAPCRPPQPGASVRV
jgi:hypothetical protein